MTAFFIFARCPTCAASTVRKVDDPTKVSRFACGECYGRDQTISPMIFRNAEPTDVPSGQDDRIKFVEPVFQEVKLPDPLSGEPPNEH